MTNYASPKAALLAAGRIDAITRGRISKANNDWIDEQLANGAFTITGMTVSKPKAIDSSKAKDIKPTVQREKTTNEKWIPDVTIIYHKSAYHAVANDGTVFSMAEVCNNCRVSLVQCGCGSPTILGGLRVRIVPND